MPEEAGLRGAWPGRVFLSFRTNPAPWLLCCELLTFAVLFSAMSPSLGVSQPCTIKVSQNKPKLLHFAGVEYLVSGTREVTKTGT